MTADYLTTALRACRLPIRVEAVTMTRGIGFKVGGRPISLTWQHARDDYVILRDRLLRQEDSTDAQ